MENLTISQVEKKISKSLSISDDCMPLIIQNKCNQPTQYFFKKYKEQFHSEMESVLYEGIHTESIEESVKNTLTLLKATGAGCLSWENKTINNIQIALIDRIMDFHPQKIISIAEMFKSERLINIGDGVYIIVTNYCRTSCMQEKVDLSEVISTINQNKEAILDILDSYGLYNDPEIKILETENKNYLVCHRGSHFCGYFDSHGDIIRVASREEWDWAESTWDSDVKFSSDIEFDLGAIDGESQRAKVVMKAFERMGFKSEPWLLGTIKEDKNLSTPVTSYTYDILDEVDPYEKYGYDEIHGWDVISNDESILSFEIILNDRHRNTIHVVIEETIHNGEVYTFLSHCYTYPENEYDDRSDLIWETRVNIVKGSQLTELKQWLFSNKENDTNVADEFIKRI